MKGRILQLSTSIPLKCGTSCLFIKLKLGRVGKGQVLHLGLSFKWAGLAWAELSCILLAGSNSGPLKHSKPPQTSTKPPSNHPNHISPASPDIQVHLGPLPYPLHCLRSKTTTTFIFPLFCFTPTILSLMCCLVLTNNLQTFEVINYTITLPLRGHGSIISQILIGLCAPRLNSVKCLVSL